MDDQLRAFEQEIANLDNRPVQSVITGAPKIRRPTDPQQHALSLSTPLTNAISLTTAANGTVDTLAYEIPSAGVVPIITNKPPQSSTPMVNTIAPPPGMPTMSGIVNTITQTVVPTNAPPPGLPDTAIIAVAAATNAEASTTGAIATALPITAAQAAAAAAAKSSVQTKTAGVVDTTPNPNIIPNQSLLNQQPTPAAAAAGYAPIRGMPPSATTAANPTTQFHPYNNPAAAAATAAVLQRDAAAVNAAARVAHSKLAAAAVARQRAGLDNSALAARAAAVSAAASSATARAAAAAQAASETAARAATVSGVANVVTSTTTSSAPLKPDPIGIVPNSSLRRPELTSTIPNSSLRGAYPGIGPVLDPSMKPRKNKKVIAQHQFQLRNAAGDTWVDPTMTDWPENDFRIFCGDLGNEVSDAMLTSAFSKYPSFAKARVIRDKRTGKSKGYGFVSFLSPDDYIRAFKEMNGKYVGNRPIKLRKSKWADRMKNVKNFKVRE